MTTESSVLLFKQQIEVRGHNILEAHLAKGFMRLPRLCIVYSQQLNDSFDKTSACKLKLVCGYSV